MKKLIAIGFLLLFPASVFADLDYATYQDGRRGSQMDQSLVQLYVEATYNAFVEMVVYNESQDLPPAFCVPGSKHFSHFELYDIIDGSYFAETALQRTDIDLVALPISYYLLSGLIANYKC